MAYVVKCNDVAAKKEFRLKNYYVNLVNVKE